MLTRLLPAAMFGFSIVLLAGCGTRSAPESSPPPARTAAAPDEASPSKTEAKPEPEKVTLHVEKMTERLNLV